MNIKSSNRTQHVCPLKCPSSCTMYAYVENNRLTHLEGDPNHPYTNGKLCQKGFSFLEKNNHRDRLKFPYYQDVKGSGRFRKITWEKAYEIIVNELLAIVKSNGNFLPAAFLKGTGNTGVHHYVFDEFFSSLGKTTKIVSPSIAQAHRLQGKSFQPDAIRNASLIIIWGGNPAATNIHFMPYLIGAKGQGTKIVVIDPIYTETAELADYYLQIKPGGDKALTFYLLKQLKKGGQLDPRLFTETTLQQFVELDESFLLRTCGVHREGAKVLTELFAKATSVVHLIGSGLKKHHNKVETIGGIEALAKVHGENNLFFWHGDTLLFNNQRIPDDRFRTIVLERSSFSTGEDPLKLLFISGANPLTQNPDPQFVKSMLEEIPFIVTFEQFLTPTAKWSNLILPVATFFEKLDIVVNSWHGEIAINEKAVPPYFESRSEWKILQDLAIRLNEQREGLSAFPIYKTEEAYLDAQFNDDVYDNYYVRSVGDLRKGDIFKSERHMDEEKEEQVELNFDFDRVKEPTEEFPFWLLTPHHPYRLNSQFHYLHLTEEKEACMRINPNAAKKLNLFNGEVVKVFNERNELEIKVKFTDRVPEDVVFIYEGWDPNSNVATNRFIENTNYYDTFVNITKL